MKKEAFLNKYDEDKLYDITYYHNPKHWNEYKIESSNPIFNESNWSEEIKYYDGNDVSTDICNLPTNTGGIYIFYIKGINLPFIEKYIVYIGRCHYTERKQFIRKRAREYNSDDRSEIVRMIKYWKEYLYYRYYPEKDNDKIDLDEAILIRAIRPPFNSDIPDKIEVQKKIKAF